MAAARALALAGLLLAGALAPAGTAEPPAPWSVRLTLRAGGVADTVEVGTQAGATAGFDPGIDRPEAPSPPGDAWLQAFAHAGAGRPELQRLDRSIVAPAAPLAWDLAFRGGAAARNATLEWSLSGGAGLAVELVLGGVVHDLRHPGAIPVDLSGPIEARIDVYALEGEPPSPPRDLLALPGDERGEVRLTWSPPETDGGLPLRGYHVYEESLDGRTRLATVALVTSYVDTRREIGEIVLYTVEAFNALAPSEPSLPALGLGTARERTLVPRSDPAEREGIFDARASTLPFVPLVPHARVDGAPNATDARTYDVRIELGGGRQTATLFTAGLARERLAAGTAEVATLLGLTIEVAATQSAATGETVVDLEVAGAVPVDEAIAVGPDHVKR